MIRVVTCALAALLALAGGDAALAQSESKREIVRKTQTVA